MGIDLEVGEESHWTNISVRRFAGNADPIAMITKKAKDVVIDAIQAGWKGPPFDPFELAKIRQISTTAREDVLDARLVLSGSRPQIEYNPNQPRRRVRFSIAHEIAHTLFPDYMEVSRSRARDPRIGGDDWQLELLCNIAGAEILMPTGDKLNLASPFTAESLIRLQSQFDVSMEALAIRLANVSRMPFTIVVAARIPNGDTPLYRIDYTQPSRTSKLLLPRGLVFENHIFAQCTAVGYTAKGIEQKSDSLPEITWECVGIPPYPGDEFPRVIGIASLRGSRSSESPSIVYLRGNALEPRGLGTRIIAQVVNDKTPNWGAGFAREVAIQYPDVQNDFWE
jgi:hypothetical protein